MSKKSKIPVSFLSFIYNILYILQEKSFEKTNSFFCSYNIISSLFEQFGLVIKHGKTEIFYFSRSHRLFNLPFLNLSVRVVNNRLSFILFSFSFIFLYFILSFFFLLEHRQRRQNVMSYVT